MAPVSPGVVQALLTGLLHSFRFLVIGLSCDNLCYGLALESIGLYCIHCWQLLYFDKSVWLPVDFVKKISKERQP
ncbi:hypothetical protein V6N11_024685 [Hibiscus sabdariffa]|uniref:Uncharacterized protein n=1 Tax=Hibiscus sabdariffa TaxID=183260 RepID=A0ABR2QMT7_9ROSI